FAEWPACFGQMTSPCMTSSARYDVTLIIITTPALPNLDVYSTSGRCFLIPQLFVRLIDCFSQASYITRKSGLKLL
ncbi:hypothetical protein BaRGS_00001473, partial [Batillaria attramentaria]